MPQENEGSFADRIESEARSCSPIQCSDLTCSDCKFRYDDSDPELNGSLNGQGRMRGPTSVCDIYDMKPSKVLLGGECELKEK